MKKEILRMTIFTKVVSKKSLIVASDRNTMESALFYVRIICLIYFVAQLMV